MTEKKPKRQSRELVWVGQVAPGSAVPLPEGWPAESHSEPDAAKAAEKLASGLYVAADGEE